MKPNPVRNVRISDKVGRLIDKHAPRLGWTNSQFAERCVEAIAKMMDAAPGKRSVPEMVAMSDATKTAPESLNSSPTPKKSATEMANHLTRDAGRAAKRHVKKA